jgi:hypothetical protein
MGQSPTRVKPAGMDSPPGFRHQVCDPIVPGRLKNYKSHRGSDGRQRASPTRGATRGARRAVDELDEALRVVNLEHELTLLLPDKVEAGPASRQKPPLRRGKNPDRCLCPCSAAAFRKSETALLTAGFAVGLLHGARGQGCRVGSGVVTVMTLDCGTGKLVDLVGALLSPMLVPFVRSHRAYCRLRLWSGSC